jgi:mono/diheme cytochrome c family protein
MAKQPKYHRALEESDFFEDGRASRPVVEGTVARGQLRVDRAFYEARSGEALIDDVPMKVDRAVLERGRERFNIYCSPCHSRLGDGQGMIVQRGFSPPPSLHEQRLRDAPAGHFFHVITHGYGAMYSYASRVPPEDRWAIVAYIRALQLSQHASLADVPATERSKLETTAR